MNVAKFNNFRSKAAPQKTIVSLFSSVLFNVHSVHFIMLQSSSTMKPIPFQLQRRSKCHYSAQVLFSSESVSSVKSIILYINCPPPHSLSLFWKEQHGHFIKHLLCSTEQENGFGVTWGWVNDWIFIFHLLESHTCCKC